MEAQVKKVDILGVGVSAINLAMAIDVVGSWIDSGERQYVCVRDVHGLVRSLDDPDLLQIHREAGMVTPDGMPLVWAGRWAGADWMGRVYGPDLLLEICLESLERGWSHYFYGAGPGVADELSSRLHSRFPGLKVVGTHTPPFRDITQEEVANVAQTINDSGADIVWVGLSSPKQERWMHQFRPLLDAAVLVGIGAAFDIHAGRIRQAPRWMQRSGLEWAFRIAVEPRRLWRRYAQAIPRFMWEVAQTPPQLLDAAVRQPAEGGKT